MGDSEINTTITKLNNELIELYEKEKIQNNLSLQEYAKFQDNKKNIFESLIINYIKQMDEENMKTMHKIIGEYAKEDGECKKIKENFENIVNFVQKSNTDITSK